MLTELPLPKYALCHGRLPNSCGACR